MSTKSFRAQLVLWMLDKSIPFHTKLNPKRQSWDLSLDDLREYEDGSLGKHLGIFYESNALEPIPKAERHDVFHVLLGYSTHVIDEAAMQFFLWGNGKPSCFTIGTCFLSVLLFPEKSGHFLKAFQQGKRSTSIRDWDFKSLLSQNIQDLKKQINL